MDFIIDAIVEWLKGLLVDGIMGNLDGLFDNVNQSVGEIATQVGTTPADWNAGVFSMIRQISETAILPIAGVILTFVMTYDSFLSVPLFLFCSPRHALVFDMSRTLPHLHPNQKFSF